MGVVQIDTQKMRPLVHTENVHLHHYGVLGSQVWDLYIIYKHLEASKKVGVSYGSGDNPRLRALNKYGFCIGVVQKTEKYKK